VNIIANPFLRFQRSNLRRKASETFHNLARRWNFKKVPSKPNAGFTYLTLACIDDLLMTRCSLYTLARSSSALPRLVVACDESLPEKVLKDSLDFWPSEIICLNREVVSNFWRMRADQQIADFCMRHIFGYKIAACLMLAVDSRVLYSDGDVLWFRDPVNLMGIHGEFPLYGSSDIYASYHHNLLGKLPGSLPEDLKNRPFINAGVAIYNRDLHEIDRFRQYLDAVLSEDPVHRFSEQGLVAALVVQIGGVISSETVCMDHEESSLCLPSFRSKPWVARHYISRPDLRAQFWVDSFWRNIISQIF
jgi:hypothetical protein